MPDNREIESQVGAYVLGSFLDGTGAAPLGEDDDLLLVLDSLQVLRMVIAIESAFGIKVEDGDMTPENLGSVRRLGALIARKRGGSQPWPVGSSCVGAVAVPSPGSSVSP